MEVIIYIFPFNKKIANEKLYLNLMIKAIYRHNCNSFGSNTNLCDVHILCVLQQQFIHDVKAHAKAFISKNGEAEIRSVRAKSIYIFIL